MSVYPENPPGQAFVSQDTYASAGLALSGLGGGGGSAGPNLFVSTLDASVDITLDNTGGGTSAPIIFGSDGGAYAIKVSTIDINVQGIVVSTIGLVMNKALSGSFGSILLPEIVGLANTGGAFPASIYATFDTVSIEPKLGVSSIVGVSSINGVAYTGGGAGPNLTVSTLTANGQVSLTSTGPSTSQILAFNSGAALYQQDISDISLNYNGATKNTVGIRILGNLPTVEDNTVFVGTLALNNPGGAVAASIHAGANVVTVEPSLSVSSLVGVSSINGINWNAISTLVG
jgi:hypothetical protein